MSGRRSREKGKRGEREAAAELMRLFAVEAHRGVQFQGGHDSPDVSVNIPGLHVEVKRTEKLMLWPSVEQAVADAGGKVPLVLHRPSRKPWLAVVPLDDLPRLVDTLLPYMKREEIADDDQE